MDPPKEMNPYPAASNPKAHLGVNHEELSQETISFVDNDKESTVPFNEQDQQRTWQASSTMFLGMLHW